MFLFRHEGLGLLYVDSIHGQLLGSKSNHWVPSFSR